ncbi:hypothetical protein AGDE_02515 [Angomonas deanei]|uniref:Ubiquitin-2 like Rad60 SUMO-like, putative n=1 Tax=Angomonas deanei TaxID=59799 RepID=A0A7G2CMM9_9TRYP|nr:hypothetical protein AGDE_02515 [Angomonas deanei]CAD2221086.1 Ubiquitin-2 like Rad60 SUMO-like, putative [Angomonas deanei]|eukprot:EPY41409.1 hypothetical protein AGDE_02515 [Angomonas deanei]
MPTKANVHFILTGACHVEYSGRQIAMSIPLEQEDGRPTTVTDIAHQVRAEWPEELSVMKDEIASTRFKILKTGRLLGDEDLFKDALTASELENCGTEEPKVILMHLVVQKAPPAESAKTTEEVKEEKEPAGDSLSVPDIERSTEDREESTTRCCVVM